MSRADGRWLAELLRLREAHPALPVVDRVAGRYVLVGADGRALSGDGGAVLEYATPEGAVSALRAMAARSQADPLDLPAFDDPAAPDALADLVAEVQGDG